MNNRLIRSLLLDRFIDVCQLNGVDPKSLLIERDSPAIREKKSKIIKTLRDLGWTPEEISVCIESYDAIELNGILKELSE